MKATITVVDADKEQAAALRTLLEQENYSAVSCESLARLDELLQADCSRVAVVDLDTVPVDNRGFRNLKRKYTTVRVIALSSRRFHPELEEAMASHIYACLGKPVNIEELAYLLRSIFCETPKPTVARQRL
ncbi:MAG: response regulator [Thermodesulfobacteriota bacterium]